MNELEFTYRVQAHRNTCRTCKGKKTVPADPPTLQEIEVARAVIPADVLGVKKCKGCDGKGTVPLLSTMVDVMLENGATVGELVGWFGPLLSPKREPAARIQHNGRVVIESEGIIKFDGVVSDVVIDERVSRPGSVATIRLTETTAEDVRRHEREAAGQWENTILGLGRSPRCLCTLEHPSTNIERRDCPVHRMEMRLEAGEHAHDFSNITAAGYPNRCGICGIPEDDFSPLPGHDSNAIECRCGFRWLSEATYSEHYAASPTCRGRR